MSSGHQRATHARLKGPRAQAPDWHQDNRSGSHSSPSGHLRLSRVPLPRCSLQCLFGHQRGGGRLLFGLPKPPSCLPRDSGVSSPVPSQNQGATLLQSQMAGSPVAPPTLAVSSNLLSYRGICTKSKVTLARGPAVRKGAGNFPFPGQALSAGGADR